MANAFTRLLDSATDAIARYRPEPPAQPPSTEVAIPDGIANAEIVKVTDADAPASGRRRGRLVNRDTGAGTSKDKTLGSDFVAVRLSRDEAERMFQMSWVAERMVRLIVDDLFARGRKWVGDDQAAIEAMQDAERELKVMSRLAEAMIAGRMFGSALLIVCEKDDRDEADLKSWGEPLDPEAIDADGIANFWVVDRWACSVLNWHTDPSKPDYGEPFQYRVNSRIFGQADPQGAPAGISTATTSGQVVVHHSRVFRFDGKKAPLTEGWTSGPWEREWGVSILNAAIDDIMRDATNQAGVGHLVSEASVWVQRIHGFKEAIKGRVRKSEASAEEIAEQTSFLKNIYNIVFMDAEDAADRIGVNFAGLCDILNHSAERMAAIAGVPKTRFLGTSAVGLNATGEGDARDWRITVAALQKVRLDPVLWRLDQMTAAHAGLAEPPPYEWIPLGELSEGEESEVTQIRVEATARLYEAGLIDEDEARTMLAQVNYVGELGDWAPSQADEMAREEAEAQMQAEADAKAAALAGAASNGQRPGSDGPPPPAV